MRHHLCKTGSMYRDSEALRISQLREMIAAVRTMEEKWMLSGQFASGDSVLKSLLDCRVQLEHALKRSEE
jgi:hypothetical protein